MAAFNTFDAFIGALGTGVHNLNTDTVKAYLSNAAPDKSTHSKKADVAEISAGNGYTAGGVDITNTYSQIGGVGTIATGPTFEWAATGGDIGPFRYVVLYNDDAPNDELIGWYDYGSAVTVKDGEKFKFNLPSGLGTIQAAS